MATKRQKKFARIVQRKVRNGEKTGSLGSIAQEAGYSSRTAEHPGAKIISAKGMKELLIDLIPKDEAAKVHQGLLKSETLDSFPFDIAQPDEKITEVVEALGCRLLSIGAVPIIGKKIAYFAVANGKIRVQGLELYYKVTGDLAPIHLKVGDDIDDLPEEELDARLAETEPMAARYLKYAREKRARDAKAKKRK